MNRSVSPGPSELAPDYVRRIAPYVPGKPIEELAREYGLAEDEIIKLASNENPRGPSPKVREAIMAACAGVTRYPDGNGFALKSALAARYRVDRGQIVLGNGSNDVLELASQAFLRPGDEAVYAQHAFAGRSRNVPSSENSRMAGSRCFTSAGPRPRIAAFSAAFSRPLNSG